MNNESSNRQPEITGKVFLFIYLPGVRLSKVILEFAFVYFLSEILRVSMSEFAV